MDEHLWWTEPPDDDNPNELDIEAVPRTIWILPDVVTAIEQKLTAGLTPASIAIATGVTQYVVECVQERMANPIVRKCYNCKRKRPSPCKKRTSHHRKPADRCDVNSTRRVLKLLRETDLLETEIARQAMVSSNTVSRLRRKNNISRG